MDLYLLRVGHSKKLYPNISHIFGIGYYKPIELGEDDFSKKLMYFYKYGSYMGFFVEKLVGLFKLRFENDTIRFDYLTLYPTRQKGKVNPNMEQLANKLSDAIKLPYKQIIRRKSDISPNHELATFDERHKNVQDSIELLEDVKGKNIIVLDNTTTGISLIDVTDLLLSNGASNVVCICLGLGYKGKDSDWDDLNTTLKYSKIKSVCKTAFIPKEKREQWKKKQ